MKILILFLAFILGISSCTTLRFLEAFNGYNGKPKFVESKTYTVSGSGDSVIDNLAYKNIFHFDRKGRTVKHLSYKADGTLSNGGWNYIYDKMGNIVQNTLYNIDSTVMVRNNFSYNKYGQQILRKYVSGIRNTITKTEYDRMRRIGVKEGYMDDTVFHEKTILSYDNKWREIELKTFNKSGQDGTRIEKVYDQNGNMILSRWYDSTNRLYEFYKTNFDNKKNTTKIEHYMVKGADTTLFSTTEKEYGYDEKGNIIFERLSSNKRTRWITRNQFHY
jgi:hypothetical protein